MRAEQHLAQAPNVSDPFRLMMRAFFEAPFAVAVWSRHGRPLFSNQAFAGLFGAPPSADYVLLADAAAYTLVGFFSRALNGDKVFTPPIWLPRHDRPNDDRVPVCATLVPVVDDAGAIACISVTYLPAEDTEPPSRRGEGEVFGQGMAPERERLSPEAAALEERIGSGAFAELQTLLQSNARLRKSETRLRRLMESGLVGVVVSDLSGRIVDANDAFLKIVGYSRDDIASGRMTGPALNTPERLQTDGAALQLIAATGQATWEKELVRKDGTRVAVLNAVVRLETDSHNSEIVCLVLDMSEQKRAQAAARESEARRAGVMAGALDAIVLMDADGHIVDFNPAAERTFGYAKHELVGQSLPDRLLPPAWRIEHHNGMRAFRETGHWEVIGKRTLLTALRRDGTEFPAEISVVSIPSEAGPLFAGHVRDITERLRAAEAEMLRRERDAAADANAALEAFSYSVAHDLQAPRRAIQAFSRILDEDHRHELSAKAQGLLERISTSAVRMGTLIDALLSLARLSQTEVHWTSVDLSQLAREVECELRAGSTDRPATFVIDEPLVAHGDPGLLRALLYNLLDNAWKFTRGRPEVRIEFGRELVGGAPCYFVRDNGAGFDMTYAERLFTPFQRLHRDDEFEGSGVGLATVQRIVRRHGGRVWAEGVENEGATIRFTLAGEPLG